MGIERFALVGVRDLRESDGIGDRNNGTWKLHGQEPADRNEDGGRTDTPEQGVPPGGRLAEGSIVGRKEPATREGPAEESCKAHLKRRVQRTCRGLPGVNELRGLGLVGLIHFHLLVSSQSKDNATPQPELPKPTSGRHTPNVQECPSRSTTWYSRELIVCMPSLAPTNTKMCLRSIR